MRHYVQYHNPDKFGQFRPNNRNFGIVTNKFFEDLRGSTVWLVSRQGKPPLYVLCERFLVEEVGPNLKGALRYYAKASHGRSFDPPRRIDDQPWFELLRKLTGDFAFGLQPLNDKTVVQGLIEVASKG